MAPSPPPLLRRGIVRWVSNGRPLTLRRPIHLLPTANHASFEGIGLSVSNHPEAWKRIARIQGPTYALQRVDAQKGQFAVVSERLSEASRRWGATSRWASAKRGWRAIYFEAEEDESFEERWSVHPTRREAQRQVDSAAEENEIAGYAHAPQGRVEETTYLVPGAALVRRWKQWFLGAKTLPNEFAEIEIRNLYVAETWPELDGLWWKDRLDPFRYSAPRGLILPHALGRWHATDVD